jgi:BirA family biotin operon repressor/biotin-[acetyl-CoA-carboxylase] ligase
LKKTTKWLGTELFVFDEIDSTQTKVKQLALERYPEGTIVIAEQQLQGKGRFLRPWDSQKEKGIWMSVLLRPSVPLPQISQLTLVMAVVITEAIRDFTGLEAKIKWPNDILINGKKVVGILTEVQAEEHMINSLIVGIGINVHHSSDDFPVEMRSSATSLQSELNRVIDRTNFLFSLMSHLEKGYENYIFEGFSKSRQLWEHYAHSQNQEIRLFRGDHLLTGKQIGLTDRGELILEEASGNRLFISSGEVVY